MNPIFSRTLKAMCTIVVAGVLTACGSSSTVDPFKPTRVIGLGDGYNDSNVATTTVADQVAARFGLASALNMGAATGTIADLITQIGNVNGGFTAGDLVVISVGTIDVQNAASPTANNEVPELVRRIQWLLDHNVKHILVMPVLDVSRTPWNVAPHTVVTADKTATFNSTVLTQLGANFGQRSPNPVIYADNSYSPISSQFLSMTASTPIWVSPLNQYNFNGCSTNCSNNTTSLFDNTNGGSSDTYLTTAGMQWAGNLLYAATAQGWR